MVLFFYFQYVIRAPKSGVIEKVAFKVGDNVAKGALLVHMEGGNGNGDE